MSACRTCSEWWRFHLVITPHFAHVAKVCDWHEEAMMNLGLLCCWTKNLVKLKIALPEANPPFWTQTTQCLDFFWNIWHGIQYKRVLSGELIPETFTGFLTVLFFQSCPDISLDNVLQFNFVHRKINVHCVRVSISLNTSPAINCVSRPSSKALSTKQKANLPFLFQMKAVLTGELHSHAII